MDRVASILASRGIAPHRNSAASLILGEGRPIIAIPLAAQRIRWPELRESKFVPESLETD